MSESKKEQEWADRLPDEQDAAPEDEPTYRDGSPVNECWAWEQENV